MSEQAIHQPLPARDEDVRLPWLVRARPYLIILPALLLLIGILYPFVMGVYYSFTAFNFKVPDSQYNFVGLRNYVRMFTDGDFLYSTYITLAYAILTTGVELLLGLVVAMLLNRDFKRLGDLAAGTLVVYRDEEPKQPQPPEAEAERAPFPLSLAEQRAVLDFAERRASLSSARRTELATILAEPLDSLPEHAEARLNGIARGLLGSA